MLTIAAPGGQGTLKFGRCGGLNAPCQRVPLAKPSIPRHALHRRPEQLKHLRASSDRNGGSGFATGFILGGAIFGALGFLFAPQISAALLTEDQKLKLPRFLEDEVKDPEQTKQELSDKIAQLNAAIDEVSSQMKAKDPKPEIVEEVLA